MNKLWPQTLLWQTFLLIVVLMLISVFTWYSIYRAYEREPHAHQLAQMVESVVNLTRSALVSARPEKRPALLRELSSREGIRIYPVEKNEVVAPPPEKKTLRMTAEMLRKDLGPQTRITLERNGEKALFVSFHIEEGTYAYEDDEYWIALPRERIERSLPWQWMAWGLAALLLSLAGAYFIMSRVTRPLKALSRAALEVGRGHHPAPVGEAGPSEVAALARAFNQMSADLARIDSDRALILAGISHDLRTPLTRLRMNIELSGADEQTRDSMIVDIEEMDATIGQFLDFARETSGEAVQEIDLTGLLGEIAEQYTRRGEEIATEFAAIPHLTLRAQGVRRAVTNLIDNALRHAGSKSPVLLALRGDAQEIHIDVCDRGKGIPEQEVERLKLPFTRLDAARGNASGAGLGLAIVDRIARSHGGRLNLLAREGGGLVARISLPLISPASPTTAKLTKL